MELKEPCTPQEIAEWAMKAANQSEGMSLSQATRILTMIEAFGKEQYNQATVDAAKCVPRSVGYLEQLDIQKQILNLKKH